MLLTNSTAEVAGHMFATHVGKEDEAIIRIEGPPRYPGGEKAQENEDTA